MRELYPRPTDKAGLAVTVQAFLRRRQRQPHVVRNYFRAPHVIYAA
jgi:hypothetical protein